MRMARFMGIYGAFSNSIVVFEDSALAHLLFLFDSTAPKPPTTEFCNIGMETTVHQFSRHMTTDAIDAANVTAPIAEIVARMDGMSYLTELCQDSGRAPDHGTTAIARSW